MKMLVKEERKSGVRSREIYLISLLLDWEIRSKEIGSIYTKAILPVFV